MKENDTIHIRIAQLLRALEYTALIIIALSIALNFVKIDRAFYVAKAGIGLIIFAPIAGVIAVLVISIKSRDAKYIFASSFILLIFAISVVIGL